MDRNAWDVEAIRRHFVFPQAGRVVTNNAASAQPQEHSRGAEHHRALEEVDRTVDALAAIVGRGDP